MNRIFGAGYICFRPRFGKIQTDLDTFILNLLIPDQFDGSGDIQTLFKRKNPPYFNSVRITHCFHFLRMDYFRFNGKSLIFCPRDV